jgi:hypothetical protein
VNFVPVIFEDFFTNKRDNKMSAGRDRSNIGGVVAVSLRFYLLFCHLCLTRMRLPRVKADGPAFYHHVSRVVDRQFIFQATDISIFINELKGRFAQWYNRRHGRYGVLWAERFKSVLLEGGEALAAAAAYTERKRHTNRNTIELNPVRAGLCRSQRSPLLRLCRGLGQA